MYRRVSIRLLLFCVIAWPATAQDFSFFEQANARADRDESRMRDEYNRGTRAIDKRDYDGAIGYFDSVIRASAPRADGALYWKAYCQNKLGRRDEALASLSQFQKSYPQSRWLNDAKALEVELRQASGRPVSPGSESDEDLKLLAINAIMNTDSERSVPLLESVLKDPKATPRIKERALFVLAQSHDPKARDLLGSIAKGGSNPDVQMAAVRLMGVSGHEYAGVLAEVYASSNDANVKRAVLQAFMTGGEKGRLLAAARSEQNPELRREAVRMLGPAGAGDELVQLYGSEKSVETKREILRALMVAGATDRLTEVARTEKDPTLKREAIRQLGVTGGAKSADTLVAMYGAESDRDVKREIVRALFIHGSAKSLVDLARKENDPEMKREIVRNLSLMGSKEATDYMMELLNK